MTVSVIINYIFMKKSIISALTAIAISGMASASDAPLWLRNSAISPDGKTVAFTYMGDIFTVPVSGGEARQITSSQAYDSRPVWSPDGKRIAFSSNRKGSLDIYVVNAEGGSPHRITTHSATEFPLAFKDNSTLLMSANIMPSISATNGYTFSQIYSVDVDAPTPRPKLELSFTSNGMSVDPTGRVLYEDKKGFEDRFRKHERSSGTSDVWLITGMDTSSPSFKKLTNFNGHSINPQWGSGDTYYYVTEEDGTLNVYENNLAGTAKKQLTHFKDHPVRSLSVAKDGTMVFSQNGELYTMKPGGQPSKINVRIIKDGTDDDSYKTMYSSYGATDGALSPNGKEVAFVVRGDVYVTSVEYNTTRQITNTAGQERNVIFSPDGRSIIYDSERDGNWQIFKTSLTDPKDKTFVYSSGFEETPLVSTDKTSFLPVISPDGNKLAFLEDRTTLKVLDLKSGKTNTALDGKYAYSYTDGDVSMEWSPDSEWILFNGYIGTGGWNNVDIAAVKADGSEVVNLTESGYSNNNGHWTKDGKAVMYQTDKQGYRSHGSWGSQDDVFIMFLDGQAYEDFIRTKEDVEIDKDAKSTDNDSKDKKDKKDDKKKKKDGKNEDASPAKKPLQLDFANRKDRVRRLTPRSASMGDYYMTPEKDKLYYVAVFDNGADLRMIDLKEGNDQVVKGGWGFGALIPDSTGKKIFSLSNGRLKTFNTGSKEVKNIDFQAIPTFSPSKEREYIFEHMKQLVNNKFYDKNLHGVDWEKYTAEYARFLPHINNDIDFAELLSEVLGELNASHTGGRASTGYTAYENSSYLGAFYDESFDGDGLKISEVIARGPLATKSVVPGDIITAIDGEPIKAGEDYFPLLAGKTSRRVRLNVRHADGTEEVVNVKPISGSQNSNLLYRRWVDRNKAVVDSVSGGKIGYVHIQGMNSESFRTIYDEVLGKYRNCDAIVVDTRYNGGGWLHNDVALLFNGKKYVDYAPRGRYIGSDPFSQWTKPSAMLVNECNYSDAHGTPYTYKTLGIGKVVGAPIPGTMTAVWWETQVNPGIIFGVPQVTSLDVNGNVLENQQLNPDVIIYNAPEDYLNGVDAQLIEATKLLMAK